MNGHVEMLEALRASYEFIPVGAVDFFRTESLTLLFSSLFGGVFLTGFKLAVPIMAALLITDFVLGFITRMVPQLNVFMVSLPVKITLGLLFLWMLIPFYIIILNNLLLQMMDQVMEVIRVLS
jgi:flagellar biosynthesis protein FliR